MDLDTLYHSYCSVLNLSSGHEVDEENNEIRGYIVAKEGNFKSEGRGKFNLQSLEAIIDIGNKAPKGLKSRFTHPTESDDGLGKFLGRAKEFRLSKDSDGKACVRGNLKFDQSAFNTPSGNLAGYVMNLAKSDPGALSSSIVVKAKKVYELDGNGKQTGPPLWIPEQIHASDIVDTGDAVDGLLSYEELPNSYLYKACNILDILFAEAKQEEIKGRVEQFLSKYLESRFGRSKPDLSKYRKELEKRGMLS